MAPAKSAGPAGYSGTPLVKKLGIRPGQRICLVDAPDGYEATLGRLPEGVRVLTQARAPLDLVQCFVRERKVLERRFPVLMKALAKDGMLWVSWPKKASGVETDLDGNVVRSYGLDQGLVDVKVCAVDETWSGLKFVYRKADR